MSKTVIEKSLVEELFKKLSELNREKALMKALKLTGKALLRQTQSNISSSGFNSSNLYNGVRLKVDTSYKEVLVHIMGDYRLKWFEKGTALRFTKNKSNRGYITAGRFFLKAKQSVDVNKIITETLSKEI